MSRHPYTYAADFIRSLAGSNSQGAILSRSEASKIIEGLAPVLEKTPEELAIILSNHYQANEAEISEASAQEFLRARNLGC